MNKSQCDSAVAVYWEGNRGAHRLLRVSAERRPSPNAHGELEQNEQASGSLGPSVSWAAPAGHIGRHVFSTQASAEVAMIGEVDGPVRRFYMRTLSWGALALH